MSWGLSLLLKPRGKYRHVGNNTVFILSMWLYRSVSFVVGKDDVDTDTENNPAYGVNQLAIRVRSPTTAKEPVYEGVFLKCVQ